MPITQEQYDTLLCEAEGDLLDARKRVDELAAAVAFLERKVVEHKEIQRHDKPRGSRAIVATRKSARKDDDKHGTDQP